ncbi:GNAT family N-acetyltransferase [Flagellimonas pacifica]|uniref:Protein N-acetyltransferase, RimJ/RimL family n=1 Tax=Flagellimonas pacifica TaxID=1247520 RepID=A0A285N285_9FLAO|nr:GNAT family N-acetyltransferase [Allomuricauda parva]SNZ01841.1 Protein N-acetyltransferase, RimJ/RimL family [Allomuricauda parva]
MPDYLLENQATERLLFRKILPSDFDAWLPFYHEPKSTQYWDGLPSDPVEACKIQFDRIFERYEEGTGGMNALILKETGQLIGICGLLIQIVDEIEELEIGYSVLPQYWQQGFGIEAAQKCKEFAFANDFVPSIISIIHIDNIPSQKVALKNGMHLDKTTTYKDNPVHIFRVNQG